MEDRAAKSPLSRLIRFGVASQIALAVFLFVPGSLHFWQGWMFYGVNLVVGLIFSIYLYKHGRQLLERRLLRKETVGTQRFIMQLMRTVAVWAYVLCGLDNRFGWSRTYLAPVPTWLTLLAMACYAGCYTLFVPVMNANRFAASIIRVETGQTVADSGPYRLVRHPMYAVALLVWFWVPLALGSFIALPAVVLMMLLLVWRLLNEEKCLRKELPGYVEYCLRTPYRLIPFVW